MALYSVWIGFKGYDVNALVVADSPKQAKALAKEKLDLQIEAALVDDEFAKSLNIEELVAKMRKAKDGTVHVYDEGT